MTRVATAPSVTVSKLGRVVTVVREGWNVSQRWVGSGFRYWLETSAGPPRASEMQATFEQLVGCS